MAFAKILLVQTLLASLFQYGHCHLITPKNGWIFSNNFKDRSNFKFKCLCMKNATRLLLSFCPIGNFYKYRHCHLITPKTGWIFSNNFKECLNFKHKCLCMKDTAQFRLNPFAFIHQSCYFHRHGHCQLLAPRIFVSILQQFLRII